MWKCPKIFNWCYCLKYLTYAKMNAGWWLSSRLHWPKVTTHLYTALWLHVSHSNLTRFAKDWTCMQAGGQAGRQTGRLCCLAPRLMTPQAHLSIATFPNTQGSLEMPQIPRSDVNADKRKGKLGNGYSVVYGLVPSEWTRPLTLESCRQNCEAGNRTTLRLK